MRKILLYPDRFLRGKNEEVVTVDEKLLGEIEEMKKMLTDSPNGAGLAAPQVGIDKKFFVSKEFKTKKVVAMINPRLVGTFGKKEFPMLKKDDDGWEDFYEGCLSFPNIWGTAKRYLKIRAGWQEIRGKKLVFRERELTGFEAIVFQHELDHLNGILFIDRIGESGGKVFRQVGEEMVPISIGDFI